MDITIQQLEKIVRQAKAQRKHDTSLSSTLEFHIMEYSPNHLGGDKISVRIKSNYSDAIGTAIFYQNPTR
ncbi:hypothetical protein [Spirosoma fluviale]|uniref:Uncharacterized protein n=1 Tax=Spirosoma fluviale TaxID=1597977 RepID=A0A286FC93_9BACT|nr:hypothetical protein [Spirosoma fluviale]SOD80857.1 hypothetical protein SAMN06269250_1590 [Spirosoma fluviale]